MWLILEGGGQMKKHESGVKTKEAQDSLISEK